MSQQTPKSLSSIEQSEIPPRPRAWIETIKFKDGTTLTLSRREVVVLVGPNNAGKSAALRDIFDKLQHPDASGVVVESVTAQADSAEIMIAWADHVYISKTKQLVVPWGRVERQNFDQSWRRATSGEGLHSARGLIAVHLSTEDRLGASSGVESIDSTQTSPSLPLQHLYEDDEQELEISRMFRQAFGTDLIVNRSAGRVITLHIGKRPIAPAGDRIAKAYRQAVAALPLISSQGDGMRAFVGVVLHTLVSDRDILLIDEPEAFLHPPQAATLGRLLAIETPELRQLVVATHSSDFLRGVVDAPKSEVRVVRIRRSSTGNHIRELRPEDVRKLWQDPLLRYSRILDGLFHDGVIVCEADGDCRFYGAMMDAVEAPAPKPDLLLVHSGGKQRVPTVVKALRAIDVPVRTVVDFDALRDTSELRAIFDALGGDWNTVATDLHIVQTAVQQRRSELSTDEVRQKIEDALKDVTDKVLPGDAAKKITDAVRRASPWAEPKRVGKASIPNGDATKAYERLATELRRVGLHLVEVGELEQFCKTEPLHGPPWVLSVLKKDLRNDPELEAARVFAKSLLADWQSGSSAD